MTNDYDFLRRSAVLEAIPAGTVYGYIRDSVRNMPAANHAETAHLDTPKEAQLRADYQAAEDEILELKAKLETAAPFCSPGFIEKNWRKANILHDAAAVVGNERSLFSHITDPKGIELIEAGLKLLREKAA